MAHGNKTQIQYNKCIEIKNIISNLLSETAIISSHSVHF